MKKKKLLILDNTACNYKHDSAVNVTYSTSFSAKMLPTFNQGTQCTYKIPINNSNLEIALDDNIAAVNVFTVLHSRNYVKSIFLNTLYYYYVQSVLNQVTLGDYINSTHWPTKAIGVKINSNCTLV